MEFIIITNYSSRIVEADDIEDAIHKEYDPQSVYDHIRAVVRIDREDE
jgi:hypothetical protein